MGPGGIILDAYGRPVLGADGKPLFVGDGRLTAQANGSVGHMGDGAGTRVVPRRAQSSGSFAASEALVVRAKAARSGRDQAESREELPADVDEQQMLDGRSCSIGPGGVLLDAHGRPLLGADGKPLTVPPCSIGPDGVILDADGRPVLGADGRPIVLGGGTVAVTGCLSRAAARASAHGRVVNGGITGEGSICG